MRGKEARRLYESREQTVERADANLKEDRGLRRLSGRGEEAREGSRRANDLAALDGSRRERETGATIPLKARRLLNRALVLSPAL